MHSIRLSWVSLLFIAFLLTDDQGSLRKATGGTRVEAEPEDWMFRQRAFPHGHIRKDLYLGAMRQWQALAQASGRNDISWVPVGPENIGGRITDVEADPGNRQVIYIGAASGGIFKTYDGGLTWAPVFDEALSLSIGDLALAPSDPEVLYVGTGEANAGGGSLAYDGVGVYRSLNGGLSWEHLGLEQAGSVGKILVHPQDPDHAYVATMGYLFENNAERGVFRTLDGGQHWEQILSVSDSTGAIDMVMHPRHPDTLFAATWERLRRPERRQYGGLTSAVYRSCDGGKNWEKLNLGLPAEGVGRIGLALAPSDPDILYAYVATTPGSLLGIYRSDDGGNTWDFLGSGIIDNVSFMWWFGKIFVDPLDPDLLYAASLDLFRSQNGGATWNSISQDVHVDQHALWIDPADPSFLLLGNDGGLYRSTNGGNSWYHFENLPITQFYTCEVDYQFPDRYYGGTQDNGSIRTLDGLRDWQGILGGDGFVNLVDPSNNQYVYAEFQYGNVYRSEDGGETFARSTTGINPGELRNWHAPLILDPSDPATLYFGGQRVYKSVDRARNWFPFSPVLATKPSGTNLVFGTITTLASSPADPKVLYAGTDDGQVWSTQNGGGTWGLISQSLPKRWVTRVAAHPYEAFTAYVTFSGYRWNEYQPHVFRTRDGGQSWEDLSGGLPEVPVNDIVIDPADPGELFVATDAGVFHSADEGQSWAILGKDLPRVVISDLTLHAPTRTLVAGTYGRSMYKIALGGVSATAARTERTGLRAFPNPFAVSTTIELNIPSRQEGTLAIFDLNGRKVLTLHQGRLEEGIHRFPFRAPTKAGYLCRWSSATNERSLLLTGNP